ncbi:RNA helicase aquarius-like [Salvelinus sp. IW2-2015]|uniref:RNA helicase aquarius-like n=1 Tax=Salvelinus sp. IW2-2015 TaxID=2691554 RepID=UPI000CDF5DC8|nr:intron-binding protein aquarius-like [Salvelinus alpinus]XP_023842593.1 intron-binding protein aquarius-like [Salvelinus alpinus]
MQREEEGHLFCKLLDILFYTGIGINDQTGNALTEKEMTTLHYDRITSLQKAAFAHFPELQDFALSNVGAVDTQESLTKQFGHFSFRVCWIRTHKAHKSQHSPPGGLVPMSVTRAGRGTGHHH